MIKINFNPKNEMMLIQKDNTCIFHGNYWDFNRDPEAIKEFLTQCGIEVYINKTNDELI